jgi:hypothetical protein
MLIKIFKSVMLSRLHYEKEFLLNLVEESEDTLPVTGASIEIGAEGELILVGTHGKLEVGFVLYGAAQEGIART